MRSPTSPTPRSNRHFGAVTLHNRALRIIGFLQFSAKLRIRTESDPGAHRCWSESGACPRSKRRPPSQTLRKTIRTLLKTADIPVAEIAARFGVARSTLYRAVLNPAAGPFNRVPKYPGAKPGSGKVYTTRAQAIGNLANLRMGRHPHSRRRIGFNHLPIDSMAPQKYSSNRSHCLVNDPHLLFIHSATVHCYFRQSSFDLTKIQRRQLNIDRSQVLVQVIHIARTRDWNNP